MRLILSKSKLTDIFWTGSIISLNVSVLNNPIKMQRSDWTKKNKIQLYTAIGDTLLT